ncbi:MAG TPA: multiple monosaccharide ABC transporter permease [Devosia sp.]|nr:multiple monosaccharide ABC transporter permease [Devosia sp.]
MTTESAPVPSTTSVVEEISGSVPRSRLSAGSVVSSLRDYGLLLALIAIMLFFQVTTDGTLFKPVNLTNLVLQNSFIIIMALGMLMVIVAGHIDLSVGSVAGFIGALGAMMMCTWPVGPFLSNPLVASIVCLLVGAAIGAIQGYWIAYHRIPSFIVTLAGMLVFRGLNQALLGGLSIGPFPVEFQLLSTGFIPDVIGPLTIVPPTVNAAHKVIVGSGIVLHSTTMVIGILGVLAYIYFGIRGRQIRERHGYDSEPLLLFVLKTAITSALALFLTYSFATYKGLPNVLIVMGLLIGIFIFITKQTTIGRRVYAMGGNVKAAQLSGIDTNRLTLIVFTNMGVLSALGGLIIAARLNMAVPAAGQGAELDVIAAVFIGGASAMGGVGQVAGAVIGAFIMGVMNNGMSINGLSVDWQQVVKGLVLLGAVVFDVYNKRNKA